MNFKKSKTENFPVVLNFVYQMQMTRDQNSFQTDLMEKILLMVWVTERYKSKTDFRGG